MWCDHAELQACKSFREGECLKCRRRKINFAREASGAALSPPADAGVATFSVRVYFFKILADLLN
jgi:hypothetical protein